MGFFFDKSLALNLLVYAYWALITWYTVFPH